MNHLPYEKEKPIQIKSVDTGKVIGNYRLDFVVDHKVIIEAKAIKFTPQKMEQQLYSYLKNTPYQVGLMINFGSSKLYIRRIIYTEKNRVMNYSGYSCVLRALSCYIRFSSCYSRVLISMPISDDWTINYAQTPDLPLKWHHRLFHE